MAGEGEERTLKPYVGKVEGQRRKNQDNVWSIQSIFSEPRRSFVEKVMETIRPTEKKTKT